MMWLKAWLSEFRLVETQLSLELDGLRQGVRFLGASGSSGQNN